MRMLEKKELFRKDRSGRFVVSNKNSAACPNPKKWDWQWRDGGEAGKERWKEGRGAKDIEELEIERDTERGSVYVHDT